MSTLQGRFNFAELVEEAELLMLGELAAHARARGHAQPGNRADAQPNRVFADFSKVAIDSGTLSRVARDGAD